MGETLPRWLAWGLRIVVLLVVGGFVLAAFVSKNPGQLFATRFALIPLVLALGIVWALTERPGRGDHRA